MPTVIHEMTAINQHQNFEKKNYQLSPASKTIRNTDDTQILFKLKALAQCLIHLSPLSRSDPTFHIGITRWGKVKETQPLIFTCMFSLFHFPSLFSLLQFSLSLAHIFHTGFPSFHTSHLFLRPNLSIQKSALLTYSLTFSPSTYGYFIMPNNRFNMFIN